MFKQGDEVSYTIKRCFPGEGINWRDYKKAYELYYSEGETTLYNGVIGNLSLFYLPLTLPDGEVKQIPYADLTFGTDNKASFKSRLPQWKGIKNGEEVIIPGNVITVRGVINPGLLSDLHIPVIVEDETRQVPYENLTFKE